MREWLNELFLILRIGWLVVSVSETCRSVDGDRGKSSLYLNAMAFVMDILLLLLLLLHSFLWILFLTGMFYCI